MPKAEYDFAGWVTKNDIECSDGVTIKQDAFKDSDGQKVPLVWNHTYGSAKNVLGHIILHNTEKGMYGHGYLNDTEEGTHAKELITHGDISAMSIGARKIKKSGKNVIHGLIYEVSLVMAGANPGALIEHFVTHSDDGDEVEDLEKAVIFTGNLIHSADDILSDDELEHAETKTIGSIIATMNDEQRDAVTALIGSIVDDEEDDITQSQTLGENDNMKTNVFDKSAAAAAGTEGSEETVLTHSVELAIFEDAKKTGTLKEAILQHGITNIEMLFPEAHLQNTPPLIYRDPNTSGAKIVAGITKSPFSKVKTMIADLTADSARARGYIKGNEKFDQVFSLLTRSTGPQTIYKKQSLDRDDIIDITDFDVVKFVNSEMKDMLIEEMGRAAIIGDGREVTSADKIKPEFIRPIWSDDDLYTIKKTATDTRDLIETLIRARAEFRGSGTPSMYVSPLLLAELRLMRDKDDKYLFGEIPTAQALALRFGVAEIVETTFLKDDQALVVNLRDYTFGATKGGEITTFDDFDIDFNKYKYLIETRLSGALTMPKSAIAITITAPVVP